MIEILDMEALQRYSKKAFELKNWLIEKPEEFTHAAYAMKLHELFLLKKKFDTNLKLK